LFLKFSKLSPNVLLGTFFIYIPDYHEYIQYPLLLEPNMTNPLIDTEKNRKTGCQHHVTLVRYLINCKFYLMGSHWSRNIE